jgi:hypothetical protein
MECENCGHVIFEDVCRILGITKNSHVIAIHYYCLECGGILISKYKKEGRWIIEQD